MGRLGDASDARCARRSSPALLCETAFETLTELNHRTAIAPSTRADVARGPHPSSW